MPISSTPLSTKSARRIVVVSGYYGFDNLGDEAILEEIIGELKQLVAADEIVVLSNNPRKTTALYGVNALNRWHLPEFLLLMRKSRLFISGGGGLFQDASGPGSVVFYGGQIVAARLSGVPVLIYAQGLGPLKGNLNRQLARFAWKLASYITVRDDLSLNMAQSWGLAPQLTADPVWSLTPSPLPEAFALSKAEQINSAEAPLIGVSLRPSALLKPSHLPILARIFKTSFPPDSRFVMLPLQKLEDEPLLENLISECGQLGIQASMINSEELEKPSQWLKLMEQLDMVVGMRLHALLMALKAGKPVVGLPYDPKVTYLCQTAGQPLLDFQQVDEADLETDWLNTLKSAYLNRSWLAKQANDTVRRMQEKSCQNFDILARILEFET